MSQIPDSRESEITVREITLRLSGMGHVFIDQSDWGTNQHGYYLVKCHRSETLLNNVENRIPKAAKIAAKWQAESGYRISCDYHAYMSYCPASWAKL